MMILELLVVVRNTRRFYEQFHHVKAGGCRSQTSSWWMIFNSAFLIHWLGLSQITTSLGTHNGLMRASTPPAPYTTHFPTLRTQPFSPTVKSLTPTHPFLVLTSPGQHPSPSAPACPTSITPSPLSNPYLLPHPH